MKAIIADRKEIAKGTLLVTFSIQEQISFKPGQFFFVTLLNPPYTDQKGNRRHFSIVNSPTQNTILQMATRLRDSAFKKSLQELPLNTEVEVEMLTKALADAGVKAEHIKSENFTGY